jgi:hypothetical protein
VVTDIAQHRSRLCSVPQADQLRRGHVRDPQHRIPQHRRRLSPGPLDIVAPQQQAALLGDLQLSKLSECDLLPPASLFLGRLCSCVRTTTLLHSYPTDLGRFSGPAASARVQSNPPARAAREEGPATNNSRAIN